MSMKPSERVRLYVKAFKTLQEEYAEYGAMSEPVNKQAQRKMASALSNFGQSVPDSAGAWGLKSGVGVNEAAHAMGVVMLYLCNTIHEFREDAELVRLVAQLCADCPELVQRAMDERGKNGRYSGDCFF